MSKDIDPKVWIDKYDEAVAEIEKYIKIRLWMQDKHTYYLMSESELNLKDLVGEESLIDKWLSLPTFVNFDKHGMGSLYRIHSLSLKDGNILAIGDEVESGETRTINGAYLDSSTIIDILKYMIDE